MNGPERVPLAHLPTPLEEVPGLAGSMRGARLWIKRDDCTGLAGGGNKVRKLEYLLADALSRGARTVVTGGAVQSNHVRQTAAACARLGMDCHALLARVVPGRTASYEWTGNVGLARLLGAHVEFLESGQDLGRALREAATRHGPRSYLIPPGGTNSVGIRGYEEAVRELHEQCAERGIRPTAIVTAAGTGGTLAGLASGVSRHMSGTTVIGVSVSCADDSLAAEVRDLLRATDVPPSGEHSMVVDTRFVGAGYGIPSPGGTAALRRFAATAGILLDPVYTGKGAHGLLELAGEGAFPPGGDVVFLHTGGLPGLFGYPETMAPEGDPA